MGLPVERLTWSGVIGFTNQIAVLGPHFLGDEHWIPVGLIWVRLGRVRPPLFPGADVPFEGLAIEGLACRERGFQPLQKHLPAFLIEPANEPGPLPIGVLVQQTVAATPQRNQIPGVPLQQATFVIRRCPAFGIVEPRTQQKLAPRAEQSIEVPDEFQILPTSHAQGVPVFGRVGIDDIQVHGLGQIPDRLPHQMHDIELVRVDVCAIASAARQQQVTRVGQLCGVIRNRLVRLQ